MFKAGSRFQARVSSPVPLQSLEIGAVCLLQVQDILKVHRCHKSISSRLERTTSTAAVSLRRYAAYISEAVGTCTSAYFPRSLAPYRFSSLTKEQRGTELND